MKKQILIILALFSILPSALTAQQVILPSRQVTVRTALGEIEKQSDYSLVVDWESFDATRTVMLPASSLSVRELLDKALVGTGCRYEIEGLHIIISRTESEPLPPQSVMNRTSLPHDMKMVPDPYSKKQLSGEQLARISSGYWQSVDSGGDSIGLAVLHFRVNSTRLERTYMDNARTLDVIHRTFSDKKLLTDMDFITITAAASPEGYSAQNAILAQKRAMAIKSYIMWKYPFMNRESIFTFSIGEDWTGLRKMVEDDRSTPQREEALRILDSDHDNNTKRSMLRRLGGGTSYRHMAIHHLPRLRGGAACMIYYKPKPEPVITDTVRVHTHSTDTVHVHTHTVDTVYVERVVEKLLETAAKPRRPYYWAVKSNMLYDAVLVPDLAVEFTIGRHVSLELNGQWSWWNSRGHHKWAWRFQMAGLEARYWLGNRHRRTPLSGHALGLYGIYGNYDIRFGPDHTGNLSRESFSAGLSYSYGLPVARSWNIEFGISVGYMRGRYETYTSYDDDRGVHLRDNGHLRSYIGPTKLRISISWLPGGKNNLPAAKDKKNKK